MTLLESLRDLLTTLNHTQVEQHGDEVLRLHLVKDVERQCLALLSARETQFFSNDYQRRLFVYDTYRLSAALRHEIFLLRAKARSMEHEVNREQLSSYTERYTAATKSMLLELVARLEETERSSVHTRKVSENTVPLRASVKAVGIEETLVNAFTAPLMSEVSTQRATEDGALHSQDPAAEQQTEDNRLWRLYVERLGVTERYAEHRRRVLHVHSDTEQDLVLVLWDRIADLSQDWWQGMTLHAESLHRRNANQLHTSSQTLIVIEPDVLMDVTDVAECFQGKSFEARLFFLKRLSVPKTSQSLAVGTLVNHCFDALLANPTVEFDSVITEGLRGRPLSMLAAIQANSLGQVKELVREQFNALRILCEQWQGLLLRTEPSFASARYGLQGRLDLLIEYPDDAQRKTIVELKSGAAPTLRVSTSGSTGTAMWSNHMAQISCYNLLLDSAFEHRRGDSQILYARSSEAPLRNAQNDRRWKNVVLECRNAIVALEHQLSQRNFKLLNRLLDADFQVPSFMQEELRLLQTVLSSSSKTELRYLQAYLSFVVREHLTQRLGPEGNGRGFAALWSDSLSEKLQRMSVVLGLTIDHELSDWSSMHPVFRRDTSEYSGTTFRVGDVVILRPETDVRDQALKGQLLKASIRRLDEQTVELSLRNKSTPRELFSKNITWCIEADLMDSSLSALYSWFMRIFRAEHSKRRRLLGMEAPRSHPIIHRHYEGLTSLQEEIVNCALASQDYFLIQGPPGTGKTSVMVRTIVQELLGRDSEIVLLAAFTNRAVDEMCEAVKEIIPAGQLLRMGKVYGTDTEQMSFQERAASLSFEEQRSLLESARVIACTVSFLHANPDLEQLKHFSTAVIDEASQLGEAQLIGILATVDRTILIGDEKQLPAVVTQAEALSKIVSPELDAIGIRDLRASLFERLLERCRTQGWNNAFRMLEQQARMHGAIQDLASQLYYHGRLQPLFPWQRNTEKPLGPTNAEGYWKDIDESRLVFIRSLRERSVKRNLQEARMCAAIVEHIARRAGDAFHHKTVGVISPFRAQVREIEMMIDPALRSGVSVDTVERFQGSERDVIIFSAAVHSISDLRLIQSLSSVDGIEVDRKLNVAITRARQQFILIGDETILRTSVHYQRVIDYILTCGTVLNAFDVRPRK